MLGPNVAWYLAVAAFLFGIGALGVLIRRNTLIVLLSLELMLNAGNLALIALSRHWHNGAGVDEHLRGRDELGREEQVQDRERGQVPDQRERRVEGVRERHHGDPRAEAREGGEDPDDPDEHVPRLRGREDHECSS